MNPLRRAHPHSPPPESHHGMLWSGLLTAVLVGSIAAASLYFNQRFSIQHDLSASARHSLTSSSIDTIQALSEPLTVTAVIGPRQEQRDAIEALMSRYGEHKSDIKLEFVNPETEPTRARELNAAPGGELILTVAGREQRLQNLSERSVTEALNRLNQDEQRRIVFVTGHGERTTLRETNDDFHRLAEGLVSIGMPSEEISLVTTPRIPSDIDVLVIAAPVHKYFPGEVASIVDYIGRGGNLLWLIDEQHDTGLRALALEFGVDALPGVVVDASSAAYGADSPTFAVLDKLPAHAVSEGLNNPVLLPAATALAVTPLAGQRVLPLLQTGDRSWTELGDIAGEVMFDEGSAERRGPLVTGITIERDSSGASVQRIAIVGDADWLASQWIGNGSNRELALRLFNWLATQDSVMAFNTPSPADGIIDPSPRTIMMLGGGFLLLLPLLLASIAAVLWQRQRHG